MSAAPRVQIVDYKLGNLFSIQQACQRVGMEVSVSSSTSQLEEVDGVILPGVGAFGNAMENLRELNLIDALHAVVAAGKPVLGICLGMQLLFEQSEEFGNHRGLGLLPGRIRRLPEQQIDERKLRVPNVGWNLAEFTPQSTGRPIREAMPATAFFYFVHSYYADAAEPTDVLTATAYGRIRYCSAVQRANILGVQFHPEKSAQLGLQFYQNWASSLCHTKRVAA